MDEFLAELRAKGLIAIPDQEIVAQGKGGVEVFRGMLSEFPPAILAQAAAYAIHKKCQDASGGSDIDTEAKAKEAAADVVASLKAGTWAKRGGPRLVTFEAWLEAKAKADAKALVKPGKPYAGKDEAKVAAALQKHEPWLAKARKDWDARQAKVDTSGLELDI